MTAVFGGPVWLQQSLCVLAILVLRWGALRYGWHLPEMKERTR